MAEVCKTCRAPIVWSLTPAGARAPIDLEPVEGGTVLLLAPTGFGGPLSVVLSKNALEVARGNRLPLRMSHWASCPDREAWREKTDAKAEVL